MSERITAVLDQIEAQQQAPLLPEGIMALPLLQMAYLANGLSRTGTANATADASGD